MTLQSLSFSQLRDFLSGNIADDSLEALLTVMQWSFAAAKREDFVILGLFPRLEGYHENLTSCYNTQGFEGRYVFRSKDDHIHASALFHHGDMHVHTSAVADWDISIIFRDVPSFWRFLFSGGNDILQPILNNDVEVFGNVNYLYKFGYMARDLMQRVELH
jgi:hypothetical protein